MTIKINLPVNDLLFFHQRCKNVCLPAIIILLNMHTFTDLWIQHSLGVCCPVFVISKTKWPILHFPDCLWQFVPLYLCTFIKNIVQNIKFSQNVALIFFCPLFCQVFDIFGRRGKFHQRKPILKNFSEGEKPILKIWNPKPSLQSAS